MKLLRSSLFACCGFSLLPMAPAQPTPPVQITRSHVHHLASQAVADTYVIQVRLPESYEAGPARYPVLYVLDSDVWFGVATDMADNLPSGRETPEVIVVGVGYGSLADWAKKRTRDLTPTPEPRRPEGEPPLGGGAQEFREFIATELIPFVDTHYRTKENDRALIGYSYGGLFAVQTLFTRPELFQRYVLIAPSLDWDERLPWKTEAAHRASNTALPATVFTAIGDHEDLAPWQDFNRLIAERRYEGLRWVSQVFPDETHLSVYPSAFTRGLRAIYAGTTPRPSTPNVPPGAGPAALCPATPPRNQP